MHLSASVILLTCLKWALWSWLSLEELAQALLYLVCRDTLGLHEESGIRHSLLSLHVTACHVRDLRYKTTKSVPRHGWDLTRGTASTFNSIPAFSTTYLHHRNWKPIFHKGKELWRHQTHPNTSEHVTTHEADSTWFPAFQSQRNVRARCPLEVARVDPSNFGTRRPKTTRLRTHLHLCILCGVQKTKLLASWLSNIVCLVSIQLESGGCCFRTFPKTRELRRMKRKHERWIYKESMKGFCRMVLGHTLTLELCASKVR